MVRIEFAWWSIDRYYRQNALAWATVIMTRANVIVDTHLVAPLVRGCCALMTVITMGNVFQCKKLAGGEEWPMPTKLE